MNNLVIALGFVMLLASNTTQSMLCSVGIIAAGLISKKITKHLIWHFSAKRSTYGRRTR